MASKKIDPRWERFCHEYIKDQNGTRAALAAGAPEGTASIWASKAVADPRVQKRIKELLAPELDRLKIEVKDVLDGIAAIARVDLKDAYDENGQLLPVKDMPISIRKALVGVDVSEDYSEGVNIGRTSKLKFPDRLKAWELLGKTLKMFTDRVEHGIDENLADQLAQARERVKQGRMK